MGYLTAELAEADGFPSLVQLCLQAALAADFWRVQRRHLACLPEEAANALLADLLRQQRIDPPHLELFRWCVTAVRLTGPSVDGEWMSYLFGFRALHELSLAKCCRLRDAHLGELAVLAPTLRMLSLEGCQGVTPRSADALAQLTGLLDLNLTDTHVGAVAGKLGGMSRLASLCLGGLPTRDADCVVLARMTGLQRLVLWGSDVTDAGVAQLTTLNQLTSLDLSLTQAHAPPPLRSLRHITMIHCELDLQGEEAQERWLAHGPVLPALEDLQLHKAAVQLPWGQALLQALVEGAAPALRRLNLSGCNVDDLRVLAAATALRELDLAGARVGNSLLPDFCLGHLALLPLETLNLDRTAVTDAGVGQLLAMTSLRHLSLACVGVADACWPVLAQLQLLESLDLSNSRFAAGVGILPQHHALPGGRLRGGRLAAPAGPVAAALADAEVNGRPVGRRRSTSFEPPRMAQLTRLGLANTKVDDTGCRRLAGLLPRLEHLQLSSSAVSDAGFKVLCESLPHLQTLEVAGCMLTDSGVHAAGQLSALRRLSISDCWLVSEKEAQAVMARGAALAEVLVNGRAVRPALTPQLSIKSQEALSPRARTLTDDVKAFDERLRYATDEMLALRRAPSSAEVAEMRARLPRDLRADLWKDLL
eukprot:scaffold5.g1005.t1